MHGGESLCDQWFWENGMSIHRRMNPEPWLSSSMKINSKQIKELNIAHEILKPLEENTGEALDPGIKASTF